MMKCTVCSEGSLKPAYLDSLLPCHTCSNCGGSLLKMTDYFRWQDDNPDIDSFNLPPVDVENIEADETSKAVICPKSGGLMTKYRISKDTDHRLDFSASINAVWMDKGEWALLKANGLAGRLNNVFTRHWQHDIREQESADVMQELYKRRFGDHYQALKEFRSVLDGIDQRNEALAYLMADAPYKP